MPYKYIGRTTDYKGKTLWEIVGNLKNYGVGRIVVRSRFERYPEPSYMKILKVEPFANPVIPSMDNPRTVKVVVENTFRGKTFSEPLIIDKISYKTDYRLIPKDEEEAYCQRKTEDLPIKILPRTMEFPPLMKEFIIREMQSSGKPIEEPRLQVVYNKTPTNNSRIAEEGETPTFEISSGLGKPASPDLYKGLSL